MAQDVGQNLFQPQGDHVFQLFREFRFGANRAERLLNATNLSQFVVNLKRPGHWFRYEERARIMVPES